jgi:hypothetical protein
VNRAVAPPSGAAAPDAATLRGRRIALMPLAEAVADRYFGEFPEDLERYGDAARAWEVHDTAHCLHWAVLDVERLADLEREVALLTRVLGARGFPLEHLARNLELAADVVAERLAAPGAEVADRLRTAAAAVRVSSGPPA